MRILLAISLFLTGAANLMADDAFDTIVVCPKPLIEAIKPWLAYRMEQGRKIGIITDCDKQESIRSGIRAAAKGGKLTHVVIVGDDHPRRESDEALRKVTVPAVDREAKVNVRWGSEPQIATDNWYADLDDDNVPDVAIGRLTADSPEELAIIVRKIIDYENSTDHGPWRRRVNFIAGVGGFGAVTDTILDMATKKFVTGEIPPGYQTSMTYASLTSPYCPDPRRLPEVAINNHNDGCLFWVYIGHGQRRWLDYMRVDRSAFPILTVDHVKQMHAESGAPIAVFLACYTGAFDEQEDCLSEEMLAAPRGPVAVISGSRVTMPYANAVLGHAMLEQCFGQDHATLGEVLLHAKRDAASGETGGANRKLMDALAAAISPHKDQLDVERQEHLDMYNLIGDPLLRLRRPRAVELALSDAASAGEEIVVEGNCPIGGRCTLELVCRRDLLTFDMPSRRGFQLSEETARGLSATHARANDQRWTSVELAIEPGALRHTVKIPAECRGHCHVRIFVEGKDEFALGAADVYVRSPRAEDERDPFE